MKSDPDGDKRKWQEKKDHKRGTFTTDEIEILKHALCRYVKVIFLSSSNVRPIYVFYNNQPTLPHPYLGAWAWGIRAGKIDYLIQRQRE